MSKVILLAACFLLAFNPQLAKAIPNPSAAYCERLGYDFITVKTPEGEKGVVRVAPGIEFDAWDFYRGKVGSEYGYGARYGYDTECVRKTNGMFVTEEAVCVMRGPGKANVAIPLMELMRQNGEPLITGSSMRENAPLPLKEPDNTPLMKLVGTKALPASFDWRSYNGHAYIGGVRNQGSCGSCYAFGACAAAEGTYNWAVGRYDANGVDFSESFVIWCLGSISPYSSHFGGCGGADYDYYELQAMVDEGVGYESNFPYTVTDPGSCTHWGDPVVKMASWGRVACSDIEAIKTAIMTYGVVDAAVLTTFRFGNYSEGVYDDLNTTCGSSPCYYESSDHAIALVGWDDNPPEGGGGCWILRNSWGSGWGENGYMRIRYSAAGVDCAVCYVTYSANLASASRGSTITGNNGADWGKCIDGNLSLANYGYTHWKDMPNAPGSMVLDLKSQCTISSMRLYLYDGDSRYYRYMVEASPDSNTWATIVDRTSGSWTGWQEIAFSPTVTGRYFRVTGTYNTINKGFHVVEWQVYGTTNTTQPPEMPLVVTSTDNVTVAEGSTQTFLVKLSSEAVNGATVSVARVSGDADITVQSGGTLVFTTINWSNYQAVTLAAAEDADSTNGSAVIRCSGTGLTSRDVTATKTDNDAAVVVTNLALASRGSTITGNNGADWGKCIDGNLSLANYGYTHWKDMPNAPGSMVLDVKSQCTISSMRLYLYDGDSRYYQYRIEASPDSNTWATIVDRTSGSWTGWQELAFSPTVTGRYFRVTGTYNTINKGFHVVEWQVYGTTNVTQPPASPAVVTSTNAVTVNEGSTATFQVKLSSQAANGATVTVARVSGDADITVQAGGTLAFTTSNWNDYQTVTLAAAEDADSTNGSAVIRCSGTGLTSRDVTATEADNEFVGSVTNLALASRGSTITGSNGAEWGKCIDGITTLDNYGYTHWKDMPNAPGSMVLDVKSQCTISSMRLYLYNGDGRYYQYRIEASPDSNTWATIVDRTSGSWTGWQEIAFSPTVTGRYFRVTGTYNTINKGFHVVEWQVYGYGLPVGGAGSMLMMTGANGISGLWCSGSLSSLYGIENICDGDTNTLWIGDPGGAPWRISIDLGQAVAMNNFELLFKGESWTNLAVAGSVDSLLWFDVLSATGWPVSCEFLYLNLWGDSSRTNPPAIREIRWNVP